MSGKITKKVIIKLHTWKSERENILQGDTIKKKNRDNYPFSSTKSHLCWVPPSEISMESSQQKVATSNNKATANSVTQHTASEPTRIICRVRELLQRKYWSGAQNKKKKQQESRHHHTKAKLRYPWSRVSKHQKSQHQIRKNIQKPKHHSVHQFRMFIPDREVAHHNNHN